MAPTACRPVLSDVLAVPVAYLRDKVSTLATGPAIALAKPAIFSLLSRVEVGTLILIDEHSGERHVFGQPPPPTSNPPCVTLTVYDAQFYLRLLLHADMGFAAAYLLHQVTCSDLTAFFQLFILNRDALNNGVVVTTPGSTLGWLFSPVTLVTTAVSSLLLNHSTKTTTGKGTKNTIDGAKVNISAHYDLGNDIFAAFLSPDMTYSCPIWGPVTPTQTTHTTKPASGNCNGTRTGKRDGDGEDLESAQLRKLHHIISLARLKPTDHVLEIGTGWGSFAIEAVKLAGCRITTLTLSREQKALAEERIASKGFEDKITVLLMDYRDEALPVPEGGFDKVVSIEMLEAVGSEFLGAYFARVHRVLRKDRGIAVFQCITMPEGRQEAYERREDFINHYIFPGGYLPSITQLLNHITAESKGTLIVEKVENIGGHYARTLRLWRGKFLANFVDKIRPTLMKEHPDMEEVDVEVFRRKWEYYFAYCEAGFTTKTLGDVIITVGREGTMELMEGIPV